MRRLTDDEAIDRHVLVMAIWLAGGFVAALLLQTGLDSGRFWVTLSAFGALIVTFAGHVVVNVVVGTRFTPRELGLGLVLTAAGLVALGLATLLSPEFRATGFLPVGLGFIGLVAGVLFYMVTHFGVRGAFEAFDVIRDFRS